MRPYPKTSNRLSGETHCQPVGEKIVTGLLDASQAKLGIECAWYEERSEEADMDDLARPKV